MKTLFSLFKTLFFVIPIVILTGCGKESDTADVMAGHAVVKYVVPDTLVLDITTWTDRPSGFVIASEFDGEHVSWEKEGNSRFDYFASLNHDEGYDFYATWEMPPACPYPVKCLSVVSDADFDEQHPTGAELCDLADICVYSMGEFVLSGYRGENVEELLFKPFSLFSDYERYLWCGGIGIYLPLPTLSRTHNLIVTFSFEGWKSVSSTVHVEL